MAVSPIVKLPVRFGNGDHDVSLARLSVKTPSQLQIVIEFIQIAILDSIGQKNIDLEKSSCTYMNE